MSDVIKIALTGKMRSGKDEIGRHLYLTHGFEYPVAFGSALKRLAHETFPHVPKDPKPRALYQFMNVMREFDKDVWVRHVERRVNFELNSKSTKGVVITDCRQQNEIDWCRANGFTIVRVVAPTDLRIERAQQVGDTFDYEDLSHSTEQEVDGFTVDYELINDGTYDDLAAKVDALVTEIKRQHGGK